MKGHPKLLAAQLAHRLFQVVRDCNASDPQADPLLSLAEAVRRLRERFPEYRRFQEQALSKRVKATLADKFDVALVKEQYFMRSDVVRDQPAEPDSPSPSLAPPSANLVNRTMLPYARDEPDPRKKKRTEPPPAPAPAPAPPAPPASAPSGEAGKFEWTRPAARYAQLGGVEAAVKELRELVEFPLKHGAVFGELGVQPSKGVLLGGAPGTGKTALALAAGGEAGVPFFRVAGPELLGGLAGESEANIRGLFRAAAETAPALLFIDEIDCLGGGGRRDGAARDLERRVVAQLAACLDALNPPEALAQGKVVVLLAATAHPDALDPSLRATGRFDRELTLPVPSQTQREAILRAVTAKMRLAADVHLEAVAQLAPGFVGGDLVALAKEAAMAAIRRRYTGFFAQRPQ